MAATRIGPSEERAATAVHAGGFAGRKCHGARLASAGVPAPSIDGPSLSKPWNAKGRSSSSVER
jgi:hypothetical protein